MKSWFCRSQGDGLDLDLIFHLSFIVICKKKSNFECSFKSYTIVQPNLVNTLINLSDTKWFEHLLCHWRSMKI